MELTFKNMLNIEGLFSLHYFEFTKTYAFDGESHPFWEFQYVDKGHYTVTADHRDFELKQGDVIFHRPNEYHSGVADGKTNPNLFVVSFSCENLEPLSAKAITVSEHGKMQLSALLGLAKKCFIGPLDNESIHTLKLSDRADAYALLEIKLRLELFILDCLAHVQPQMKRGNAYQQTIERVAVFLQSSVKNNVTLSELEARFHLHRDYLNRLFKGKFGKSMTDYYIDLKIDAAKDSLRGKELSVKEISKQLGYSSESFFCRQFEKRTGFTPLEYQRSVAAGQRFK